MLLGLHTAWYDLLRLFLYERVEDSHSLSIGREIHTSRRRETVCENNLTNRMTRVLKIAIAVSKLRGDAKNIYGFTE